MRVCLAFLFLLSSLFAAEEHLVVIHAKTADYYPRQHKLYLRDLDNSVTYFSETLPRRAGKTSLATFLQKLTKDRQSIHAGFVYFVDENRRYHDVSLSLSEAHYNFETRELSFTVKLTEKEDRLPEQTMEEVNLFIEDVPGEIDR